MERNGTTGGSPQAARPPQVQERQNEDVHFGDNLHLADGTYKVTISVVGERAAFKTVAVGRPCGQRSPCSTGPVIGG